MTKPSLSIQFWSWIFGGLLLLIVVFSFASKNVCLPSSQKSEDYQLLCDAKGTDLGLLYFTYCLVIVGWFGIRSSERTVQNLERAFLAVGPTKITLLYTPADQKGETRPFVRLTLYVYNTGRTAATIRKVYGEFSRDPPLGNKPIYKHGNEQTTDLSVAATDKNELTPIRFESDFVGDHFFWGYIEYFDIFKIKRTSRFCTELVQTPPPTQWRYMIAGSDGWREFD